MKSRKFWLRAGGILLAVILLLRFGGVAVAPSVVNSVLEDMGFTSEIEDIEVSVLSGEFRVRGLVVRELEGDAVPLLSVQQIMVDIDLSSTLSGDPVCNRAELDGVVINLERTAEYGWNFAPLLGGASGPAKSSEGDSSSEVEFDLRLPVKIVSLRAQDIHVHLADEVSEPQVDTELTLNLTASQLGDAEREGQFEAIADATGLLDFLRVEGAIDSSEKVANVRSSLMLNGLRISPLAAWLEPLGLRSTADTINVRGWLTAKGVVTGEQSETLTVTVDTNDWAVEADGVEAVALDSSHHELDVGALAILDSEFVGMRARTARKVDGAIAVAGVAWSAVSGEATEAQASEVPSTEPNPPLTWRVDALRVRDGVLAYSDSSSDTEVELRLESLELTGIDSAVSREAQVAMQLSSPGVFEEVRVQGELTPGPEAVSLAGSFELGGCSADRCKGLLESFGIAVQMTAATAHGALAASIQRGELAGSLELSDLWMKSGEDQIGLDTLRIDKFDFSDGVQLGHVLVSGMHGELELHESGDVEVAGMVLSFVATESESASAESASTESASAESEQANGEGLVLKLDHFEFNELDLAFVDHQFPERSFATTAFELDVQDLAYGAESDGSIRLRAGLDAWCEQIELDGSIATKARGELDCELNFVARGLSGEPFGSFLPPDAAKFESGEFAAQLNAELRKPAEGSELSFAVSELALTLDQERVASISSMGVERLVSASAGLRIGGASLEGARLAIPGVESGESSTLTLDAGLESLQLGSREATELTARIGLEDEAVAIELSGAIRPDLEDLLFKLHVVGVGIDGNRLNHLLPPTVQVALEEGRLQADMEAWFKQVEGGGLAGGLALDEVSLTEITDEAPLFKVKRVELSTTHVDVEADRYEFGQVHVLGTELRIRREVDGAINIAGLLLDTSGSVELEEAPSELEVSTPKPVPAAPNWVRKYDTAPFPTVTLESVELELAALHFEDLSVPESVPAILAARLYHEKPLVLLSPDAESHAPLVFVADCSARPLVETATAKIELAPWEEDARVGIDISASGVQGEAVTQLVPSLKEMLDGSGLVDGSLGAKLELRVVSPRRNLLDLELRNGLGVEFSARDMAFHNGGEETPLASLGAFEVDVERVDLATGATKIESIELTNLQARVELTEDGREAFGFVLKSTVAPETVEPEIAEPQEPAVSKPYEGPEIELERLSVSGLDLVITDLRTDPPTIVPFDTLGFDLEQFTTKTFTEPKPFRFAFYTGAGETRLPKPKKVRSALAGLTGAAISAATGAEDKHEYELRPALGEIAVTGSLSLGSQPTGRVNGNVEGLELLGFSGLARESGVIIGSGVLDASMRVKLRGPKGIDVRSSAIFTNLSLDEPPNGPISRYLKLPASLDTVLFAIKNNDDEHRIPLNFHADATGLGKGEIAKVAVTTLTKVITSAVASAPLRVGDGVAGMLVIPGVDESPVSWVVDLVKPVLRMVGLADKEGPQSEPVSMRYEAGEFVLDAEALASLESMLEELGDREDFIVCMEHQFGSEDEPRAAKLANPTKEDCRRMVIGLRRRKRELARYRAECAADLAASHAVKGTEASMPELEQLRAVEVELGGIELALDETLAMLRPGSNRYATRRTRATLIEIANARLGTLERTLGRVMAGKTSGRFEIKAARPSVTTGEKEARVNITLKMKRDK